VVFSSYSYAICISNYITITMDYISKFSIFLPFMKAQLLFFVMVIVCISPSLAFLSLSSSSSLVPHCSFSLRRHHLNHNNNRRAAANLIFATASTTIRNSNNDYNNDKSSDVPSNGPEYYRPGTRGAPPGGDMAYIESNVRRSASTFQSIRLVGGAECSNDVYVRDPNTKTDQACQYFYVGKVAWCDGTVSNLKMAVARVWNLIEEHACRLRPVELGRGYGRLEVWVSKVGDMELEMTLAGSDGSVENDDDMALVKMEQFVVGSEGVGLSEVGFMAEFVTNKGVGLFITRDEDGRVVR